MRFDDRLRTVLAQPAADPHDRAVRWRQLVELVARAGGDADRDLVDEALAAIRGDASTLDDRVRIAASLAVAPLALPVSLVEIFAADRLEIAAPVLASSRLTAAEWKRVSAAASQECRDFIAAMHSEQAPAPPAKPPEPPSLKPEQPPKPQSDTGVPSISEVVARIERLRQAREADTDAAPPTVHGSEPPRLFRWECNEAGEIDWVDGVPRGALIGRSIVEVGPDRQLDRGVERAFAARAPFHERELALASGGAVEGKWTISGVPAFEPASGRFAGYRGVALRAGEAPAARSDTADANSLRELAHEIKTPLNAIIGFAEIISGEYFGPAERRYRQRAAEIVGQARLLLAAVEDLDFTARLRSDEASSAADLADCLAGAWEGIERQAQERNVRVVVAAPEGPGRCALSAQITQRLVERLAHAVIGFAKEGETLTFRIGSDARHCTLTVDRPTGLNRTDLSPDRNRRAGDAATLPLRLVTGLARTAGGELEVSGDRLVLRLPSA